MAKILISTTVRWASAARLAGAFADLGCEVDALFPGGHALAASRYPARRHRYRPLQAVQSLADAIVRSKPDLVIPCDDRAAAHLRRLHGESDALASRAGFVTAAREAGIDAPETVSIPDEATLDFAIRLLGLPAVIKADGSWGGDGVAVVNTPEEAKAAFRRLARPASRLKSLARAARRGDAHHLLDAMSPARPSVCLQRFILGSPATTSFACWQGKVLAANHFDVLVTNGSSGPASVVRRVDDPAMEDAARRLARRFNLSGLHGLDYVRDETGRPHLIEINPRATQTSHISFGHGRDLCAALAVKLGGLDTERRAVSGRDVSLFPQEWGRDRNSPWLRAAHHDVPWDDPRVVDACLGVS